MDNRTLRKMEDEIGVSRSAISRIERGLPVTDKNLKAIIRWMVD
jgi:transcriptional regulator with XRE-family HTH domain